MPAKFVELAKIAILHRDPERFALLYRLLWRLRGNHDLLEVATDPDVAEVAAMAKAVRRDEHKMHAFVRFREIGREQQVAFRRLVRAGASHRGTGRAVLRQPLRRHALVDPDARRLRALGRPCASRSRRASPSREAPTEDRLEETWRSYYASIFNPARLKVKAMQTEMPKKYWRNLPEASLIKPLIASAERTARAMIESDATEPHKAQKREDAADASQTAASADSLEALREEAADCRACPLWKDATQTVFGEGPHARG